MATFRTAKYILLALSRSHLCVCVPRPFLFGPLCISADRNVRGRNGTSPTEATSKEARSGHRLADSHLHVLCFSHIVLVHDITVLK